MSSRDQENSKTDSVAGVAKMSLAVLQGVPFTGMQSLR